MQLVDVHPGGRAPGGPRAGRTPRSPGRPSSSAWLAAVLLACVCTVAACAGPPARQVRQAGIAEFLASPAPSLLLYRPGLSVRAPLVLFGAEDQGPALSALAGISNPLSTLAGELAAAVGLPPNTRVIEVTPTTLADLRSQDPDALVLFLFSGGWYLDYQRFPLRLQDYRLSFSVIAKLLPRGRVVRGTATLALPGAAWEGTCYYVGARYPLEVWRRDGGERLREEMAAGRTACGQRLAIEFQTARGTVKGQGS
jgi:hypothetical protein